MRYTREQVNKAYDEAMRRKREELRKDDNFPVPEGHTVNPLFDVVAMTIATVLGATLFVSFFGSLFSQIMKMQ